MQMEHEIWERASQIYGDILPEFVRVRVQAELDGILGAGHAALFTIAQKRMENTLLHGWRAVSRGYVGASAVVFFLGITEVNPLPPHYLCPRCRYHALMGDGRAVSGFDLPPKACPRCGGHLNGNGHDLPFETLLGPDGRKLPHINLYFARTYLENEDEYMRERLADTLLMPKARPHPMPDLYHDLEARTGIPVSDVPPWDVNSCRLLIAASESGKIPGMEKPRLHRLLHEKQPQTMRALVQTFGLAHRTAIPFLKSEESQISEEISTQETVMRYFIGKGIGFRQAFDLAEQVSYGITAAQGFAPCAEELLRTHGVPEEYL